ncbi:MAG TPA: glycine cleavage system aminomethyltransferase GcvT [bacterium (Candidatus Stahlbacteria)]|nr:glycine cleavage system aminomethyltransferase GcvT [Candidatus Stahlbacteria bacterium]
MKRTPFFKKHQELGGQLVSFAGFQMPIKFEGVIPEHLTVRSRLGLFDVSHMGEIEIRGPDRIRFANWITTNDVASLEEYQVQYSTMLYPDGGIVDDLLIYRLPDRIFLVVNAANTDKDFVWIDENRRFDCEVENISDRIAQLALQGPIAQEVMARITSINLDQLRFYRAVETDIEKIPVILSRTGYTGEDGFEIYSDAKAGPRIWDFLFAADPQLKPIGLGARDTLRLEMKYCLYGNDITRETNPLEAGLSWIIKMDKEDGFIGKEALVRIKEQGLKRRLVAFVMEEGIPRPDYRIFADGKEVGFVTSGNYSPCLKRGIGVGYVAQGLHKPDTQIQVDIRGKMLGAKIIKPPFYKGFSHR